MISMIFIYYATPKYLRKELVCTAEAWLIATTQEAIFSSKAVGKKES